MRNTVTVDVDVSSVLSELDDEDLLRELKERHCDISGQADRWCRFAAELRDSRSDERHFNILLERMLDQVGVRDPIIPHRA